MSTSRSLWFPLALTAALPAQAPADVAERIVHEGFENSRVMEFQDYLCNHIGGRLTGSDNFTRAAEWARDEFAKMGLDARLEQWGEWDIVWNRGQWAGYVLADEETGEGAMDLQVATPAWTAGTKGQVKGQLVWVPETEDELEKIAPRLGEVYLYGKRPSRGSSVYESFKEATDETSPLGFVQSARSTGMTDKRYENQIRVFGNDKVARGSWDRLPAVPEIVVRNDQAKILEDRLDAGEKVMVIFDIRNRFRPGPIPLNNVIADLPGTEKPDEYVIVCGHLDSWHQATGATDNGTGTTSTMEAARILTSAGAKPKRTIRFILWGGEEQGLLGSQEYTKIHRADMAKVSAVFNHDTGTNWAQSLTVTKAMQEPFEIALAPVMQLAPPEEHDGPVFKLNVRDQIGGFGGSDHASFLSKGIPAWSMGLAGRAEYGYGWHSQWDTYDIVIPEYQQHTATVLALASLGVANLPELLPREGIQRRSRGRGVSALVEREYGMKVDDELKVTDVVAKSVAARAGVKKGDLLVAMWDKKLESVVDIYRAWRSNRDEDIVEITYKRGETETKTSASLVGGDEGSEKADSREQKQAAPESRPDRGDGAAERAGR